MSEENRERAFRAAHTLKGVCGNLSLDKLLDSASKLTELLRPETAAIPEGADVLFEEVKQDYDLRRTRLIPTISAFTEARLRLR